MGKESCFLLWESFFQPLDQRGTLIIL